MSIIPNEQGKQSPAYLGVGQLPAVVFSANELFVAAVVPEGEKKAVWLLRAQRR